MAKDRTDYLDQLQELMLDAVNHGDPATVLAIVILCREHGEEMERQLEDMGE